MTRLQATSPSPIRLRAQAPLSTFHIVLVEPEIPQNTGNIARLCAATRSPLHLVGALGFKVDDRSLRRAGIDYWDLVQVHRHLDFAHFRHAFPDLKLHFFTAKAPRSYLNVNFCLGDALVFGRESVGLSEDLLDAFPEQWVGIPTIGAVRSLNVANAAGIALYEGLRQVGALQETFVGPGATL